MKDILIVANFCDYENINGNNRFNYIANELKKQGHNVELLTSSFSHDRKIKRREKDIYNYKITLLDEPGYKKNVCLKRFYSHYIFGKNVKKYLSLRKKPDVVYCAVPSLTCSYYAAKYCKQNNIKFIIDVQDLWPEAFKMVLNPPIIGNIIYKPFDILANTVYSSADSIIAVSQTYIDRALEVNQKATNMYSVFLGTELNTFDENVFKFNLEKNNNQLTLGYCGTLGSSYDITCMLDALRILKDKHTTNIPKFIVMGDGPLKTKFESYAKEKNIDCEFTGRLPYDYMCAKLSLCDIVINPISKGAAQSIINKHADYAASGIALLNTQENEEYCNLVNKYQMGFNCKNNDANDLAEKLLILINNEDLRKQMGKNARKCAEDMFDRKNSYEAIYKEITKEGKNDDYKKN